MVCLFIVVCPHACGAIPRFPRAIVDESQSAVRMVSVTKNRIRGLREAVC